MPLGLGFGLQFGTRGGGASVDPTAITPANADAFLASLGLTQAGTGTTWGETGQAATPLYAVAAAKVPLAVETIAGKKYFGPIVNPAGTNLALYSSDATNAAWVKTNCTASLQTGSLSDAAAANGHTLIAATANNATALQSITSTSGKRVSKFWLARGGGSGTVSITQDNGSTWADVTLTSNPQPFDIAPATLANPTVGIRIATSGDSVRLYGVQHQVAARALRPRIGPTGASTVTTGARTLSKTLSVAPPAISLSLVVPWSGISDTFLVQVDDGTLNNRIAVLVDNLGTGVAKLRAVKSGSLTDRTISGVLTPGDAIMFDIEWTATHIRGRVNGGAWGDITHTTIPTFTTMTLGNVTGFNVQWRRPILAFRDNLGNLLSAAPYGWNTRLLDNWS